MRRGSYSLQRILQKQSQKKTNGFFDILLVKKNSSRPEITDKNVKNGNLKVENGK